MSLIIISKISSVMKNLERAIFITFIILFPLFSFSQNEDKTNQIESLIYNLRNSEDNFKAKKFIKKIIKLDPAYNSVVEEIRSNKYYSSEIKTGYNEWNYVLDSLNYTCIVLVPSDYSPDKKFPASVILHGAAMSFDNEKVKNYVKRDSYNYDSLDRIIIYPTSWCQSPWWREKQTTNLNYIIRRLKQEYNIDENNIHLSGISDGGTGIIYQANLNVTPWASFRPYISNPGSMDVLSDKTTYIKNLGNRPFLFISSEKDDLFPPHLIESFLDKMKKVECKYNFILAPGYKHTISWFPLYEDTISNFALKNQRNPYPSTLFWQSDDIKYGRNHWVIINKLSNDNQSDLNEYPEIRSVKSTIKNNSGIIEVNCNENEINVKTTNIKQYTLLLSPEQFNFDEEIIVYTNGNLSFKGIIAKDISILLKWFSKDLDRTSLFGNEITIKTN